MNTTLGAAYRKLKTRYIRFRVPGGPWTTTHLHEIDEEGDWVVTNPDDSCDCILVCDPETQVTIHHDRITFQAHIHLEDKEIELQFLESRPRKNLLERLLL